METWLTFLNIFALAGHMLGSPHMDQNDNYVETASLLILALITTVLTTLPVPMSLGQSVGAAVMIFVPMLIFFYRILNKRVTNFQQRRRKTTVTSPNGPGQETSPDRMEMQVLKREDRGEAPGAPAPADPELDGVVMSVNLLAKQPGSEALSISAVQMHDPSASARLQSGGGMLALPTHAHARLSTVEPPAPVAAAPSLPGIPSPTAPSVPSFVPFDTDVESGSRG